MSLKKFLMDKLYIILSFLFGYFLVLMMFLAFKVDYSLIIVVSICSFSYVGIIFFIEYIRRVKFYSRLFSSIDSLDKAYLVLEIIDRPNFYEGELLYQAMEEINKSYYDECKSIRKSLEDFKEYIEMWIHEVKIPIATLVLMGHNHKDKFYSRYEGQIKRIEDYVEQVLYYVRADVASQDYLINEVSLKKVIGNVMIKNKDSIMESNINILVNDIDFKVFTDSKWLEFILNQVISNSIKYRKDEDCSYIRIDGFDRDREVILRIEDNGIGIPDKDISRVFEKSFTGYNGRVKSKSTGMGLFIAKKMCDKLGHRIEIDSREGEFTRVSLYFFKDGFYDVIR